MISATYNAETVDDTIAIGRSMGERLRGGEVIELISDLGGGKTTLVRGVAEGVGAKDPVSSPSFTICNTYQCEDEKQIAHFDFYRLEEAGIVQNELLEYMGEPDTVVIVEWGDIVHGVLPVRRVQIKITTADDETRLINCRFPEDLEYIFKNNEGQVK